MIRFRMLSQAMKARLEEIPALAGKVVIFDRARIKEEVNRRLKKTGGKCVVIDLLKASNTGKAKTSFYTGNYAITLFLVPLLTQGDVQDADDLMTAIEAKLQGWWPESVSSNTVMYCTCSDITYADTPFYDVSVLTVTAPGNLK